MWEPESRDFSMIELLPHISVVPNQLRFGARVLFHQISWKFKLSLAKKINRRCFNLEAEIVEFHWNQCLCRKCFDVYHISNIIIRVETNEICSLILWASMERNSLTTFACVGYTEPIGYYSIYLLRCYRHRSTRSYLCICMAGIITGCRDGCSLSVCMTTI